ncbi:hypothetical protein PV326_001168, partial [Microctonus aethiopoides]
MSAKVFFILIFCVATTLQYTPFTACKSGSTPFELRLEGCTKSPCILASGKDVEAECDFAVVFFILIFCVVTTLQYTPFTACKSGSTPFELRLEGCTKSPCILASGKDVEAE